MYMKLNMRELDLKLGRPRGSWPGTSRSNRVQGMRHVDTAIAALQDRASVPGLQRLLCHEGYDAALSR
jgi:hypothetical protein